MPTPVPAAQAGYTLNTFNSTLLGYAVGSLFGSPGFYGYNYTGGFTQNPDGSLLIKGGSANLPMLATGKYDKTSSNLFDGYAFGGGGYFESVLSFPAQTQNGATNFANFCMYNLGSVCYNAFTAAAGNLWPNTPIISTASLAVGANSLTLQSVGGVAGGWPGCAQSSITLNFSSGETRTASIAQGATTISWSSALTKTATQAVSISYPANYGLGPEWDIAEADVAGQDPTPDAIHSWSGILGGGKNVQTQVHNLSGSLGPNGHSLDVTQPNAYGGRWIPATPTSQGELSWWLNGTQVGLYNYDLYNPNLPPPIPTGSSQSPAYGHQAMSFIDQCKLMAIWGTSTAQPMTLHSFNAWQASAVANLPYIPPASDPTWTNSINPSPPRKVMVTVLDLAGDPAQQTYTVPVASSITIDQTAIPNPTQNQSYSFQLSVSTDPGVGTYAILEHVSGDNAYSISASGLITAIPTYVCTDIFSVLYTASTGEQTSFPYRVTVQQGSGAALAGQAQDNTPATGTLNTSDQLQGNAYDVGTASGTLSTQAANTATPLFDYSTGFTSASLNGPFKTSASAALAGTAVALIPVNTKAHVSGGLWWMNGSDTGTQGLQDLTKGFTTQATIQFQGMPTVPVVAGMTFVVQNTPLSPVSSGTENTEYANGYASANWPGHAVYADANVHGYGSFNPANYGPSTGGNQNPLYNSVGVKFDANFFFLNQDYANGSFPSSTGLYINGGPWNGTVPQSDLNPYGINFYSGHIFLVTIVYDGESQMTMTITDQTTGAQCRKVWPCNIQNSIGGQGYIGWLAGTASENPTGSSGANNEGLVVLGWKHSVGFNTQLPVPTASIAPGQYAGTQSLTLSSAGAIYYTTDGTAPTTSSQAYSGPISITSSTVLQWFAQAPGYTDSNVGGGVYQIGTPKIINYSSLTAGNGVIACGTAKFTGGALSLTQSGVIDAVGAAWFGVPINITAGFTTSFQLQLEAGSPGTANGMCFVIQNNTAAYSSTPPTGQSWASGENGTAPITILPTWMGGPDIMGYSGNNAGYSGYIDNGGSPGILNSVAVFFDLYAKPNSVGLLTNGAAPNTANQEATGLTFVGSTLNVTISFDGTDLNLTIAQVGGGTFNYSWPVNVPSIVGGNTAYVGFTAAAGGLTATQLVNSWTATQG